MDTRTPAPWQASIAATLGGIVAVVAVAVGVAGLLGGTDRAAAALPAAGPATTWSLEGLSPAAGAAVVTDLSQVDPQAQDVVARLAGSVAFDADTRRCPHGAPSCSYAASDGRHRWAIHLDRQTTSASYPSNRFLVYHELGHAVWGLLLTDEQRLAFAAAVEAALHGRPCRDGLGRPCAAVTEVFADEFARYAGHFARSMSFYWTPALLDTATMQTLARTWTGRPAPYGDEPIAVVALASLLGAAPVRG